MSYQAYVMLLSLSHRHQKASYAILRQRVWPSLGTVHQLHFDTDQLP